MTSTTFSYFFIPQSYCSMPNSINVLQVFCVCLLHSRVVKISGNLNIYHSLSPRIENFNRNIAFKVNSLRAS
jgi:hypothetical protein